MNQPPSHVTQNAGVRVVAHRPDDSHSVGVTDEAPTIEELRTAWSRLAPTDKALLLRDQLPSDLVDAIGQLDVARLQAMGWEVTLDSISPPEDFQRHRMPPWDQPDDDLPGYTPVDPPHP